MKTAIIVASLLLTTSAHATDFKRNLEIISGIPAYKAFCNPKQENYDKAINWAHVKMQEMLATGIDADMMKKFIIKSSDGVVIDGVNNPQNVPMLCSTMTTVIELDLLK